jgi:hypothetical protein
MPAPYTPKITLHVVDRTGIKGAIALCPGAPWLFVEINEERRGTAASAQMGGSDYREINVQEWGFRTKKEAESELAFREEFFGHGRRGFVAKKGAEILSAHRCLA